MNISGDAPMSRDSRIHFFLPGPVYVAESVRQAMTQPIVSHRSPEFRQLYAETTGRLRQIFRTDMEAGEGEVYIATGSATLVMEMALSSTVRQRALHLTGGAFSERWQAIARSLGKEGDAVAVPWGQAVDPDLVRQALRRASRKAPYEVVTLVHNETSTGVENPVEAIARVVREESDALLLVDSVSGLGGAPFETARWGVDLVLVGGQKGLALPPGLTFFTFTDRLAERAAAVPHRGFYTDLLRYRDKHRAVTGTITTPAIPLVYAGEVQSRRILEEGMEPRWRRHGGLQRRVSAWARARGAAFAAASGVRSPTVSCLHLPPGWAPERFHAALTDRGYSVGGGYGQWKASTFRIGHMGEVGEEDLEGLLEAIDDVVSFH
jgi:aspartate aminotransferase-like enzyme